MKLFGFELSKVKPEVSMTTTDSVVTVAFSKPEMPSIKEYKNKLYVEFGERNLYPQKLIEYRNISSVHNAILTGKSLMVAGEDVLFDGRLINEFTPSPDLLKFYENPGNKGDLNDLIKKISNDYELFGAYALEIVWGFGHKFITEINHICPSTLRSGKEVNGEVKYWYYSKDWSNTREYPELEMPIFDENDTQTYNQILYVGNWDSGLRYYGRPAYAPTLNWVSVDGLIGEFHNSNISNGFNPSMVLKFYRKPNSPEEKFDIVRDIKNQFGGNKNTGKLMVFFSDGKENAPDIFPVDVSNLDKQFAVIADQVVQQILSGHRLTSPMLLAIPTGSKLGYSNEFEIAFKIFDKIVISPDQKVIEKELNKLMKINGLTEKLTIKKLNPLI